MAIKFSKTSLERLKGVHPDLLKVVYKAAELATKEEDFMVLEGVRSKEQMMINYGKGRTAAQLAAKGIPAKYAKPGVAKVTWLNDPFNSNHRINSDGYGHAVDLAPYPLDWNDSKRFTKLAELMFRAEKATGINIRWGRDWNENGRYEEKGETDGPHFELVR